MTVRSLAVSGQKDRANSTTQSSTSRMYLECTMKIIIYDNFTIRIYLTEFILLHKKIPTSVGIFPYLIPNAILA